MIATGTGKRFVHLLMVSAVVLIDYAPAAAGDLNQSIETIVQSYAAAAKSQKKIDKLSDKTADLLSQYREVQRQIDSIKVYNAQVARLVGAQQEEIDGLQREIDRATNIGREVTPLMLRMIENLDNFVKLDVPFLVKERQKRIVDLLKMMDRADVTDSEKFRRILEAYQVENDYGRTIEAYSTGLTYDGKDRGSVDFLRIGRVALLYLAGDGKEVGFWNTEAKKWQELPPEYRKSVKDGLRIAKKQIAPDLIRLPIFAPKDPS